ncbi:MAG: hypothetical protein NTX45_20140 [Proteobacteria bacterium]|nr:hypothetical protein [Pseudomonadota bacterium]
MSFNEFWLKKDRHTGRDAGIQRPWMANWLHSLVLYCPRSHTPAGECLPWRSSAAETYPTAGAVKTGLPRWSVGTRKILWANHEVLCSLRITIDYVSTLNL